MRKKNGRRKGFTMIELIVVMAVIGILVLLAAPRFIWHTKEAQSPKHINNATYANLPDESERDIEGKCHESEALKQVVDVKLFNKLLEKAK